MPPKVPIFVGGQMYESASAFARERGVTRSAVCVALDRGTLENVGKGPGLGQAIKVYCQGKEYPSCRKFAKAVGLTGPYISREIQRARRKGLTQIVIRGMVITWNCPSNANPESMS